MYFGDCDLRTRSGLPVLVGRVSLMTDEGAAGRKAHDKMRPAPHLRAAIGVVERAAVDLLRVGGGVKGLYILDVGSYPTASMAKHAGQRYWDADGPPPAAGSSPRAHQHLNRHG